MSDEGIDAAFEKWLAGNRLLDYPLLVHLDKQEETISVNAAKEIWQAATEAERERCAKLIDVAAVKTEQMGKTNLSLSWVVGLLTDRAAAIRKQGKET